ncbi:MAG: hypothetical protein ACI80V_000281 [Rhodothermales bacterium]|jgi:hypothetical protein
MMRLLLLFLVILAMPIAAGAQTFNWFAATMTSGESGSEHASVMVIPESSWVQSDSSLSLSAAAKIRVEEARGRGLRVVASVGSARSEQALRLLWDGAVDGLIVPAGALMAPVSRPEMSVVLSDMAAGQTVDRSLDGILADAPRYEGDWSALDSIFASRAPTASRQTPSDEIAVIDSQSGEASLFLPGSILISGSVPDSWADLLAFRAAHPAIGGGLHERLTGTPYAFYRGKRLSRDVTDEVVVVSGVQGTARINVSTVFEDNEVVREVLTGKMTIVSYGQVSFQAGPTGLLLIELVQ